MLSSTTLKPNFLKFPFVVRRVEGHSMEPTFKEGAIVFGLTHKQARRDDVVIANIGGNLEVIKRVVDMRFGLIYLEGDNFGHTKKYSVMPTDIIAVVSSK
jgi:phage repressor protein C with HTH and peptisase S24 domain